LAYEGVRFLARFLGFDLVFWFFMIGHIFGVLGSHSLAFSFKKFLASPLPPFAQQFFFKEFRVLCSEDLPPSGGHPEFLCSCAIAFFFSVFSGNFDFDTVPRPAIFQFDLFQDEDPLVASCTSVPGYRSTFPACGLFPLVFLHFSSIWGSFGPVPFFLPSGAHSY